MSKKLKVSSQLVSRERTKSLAKLKPKELIKELEFQDSEPAFKAVLDDLNYFYRLGEPLISDELYDRIEEIYDKHFGRECTYNRGHSTSLLSGNSLMKIRLPREMPSLSKAKAAEPLNRFFEKYPNDSKVEDYLISSLKLDGSSGLMALNENGDGLQAISHGNTKDMGIDWNHTLPYINNIPKIPSIVQQFKALGISDVRGEMIIRKDTFEKLKTNPPKSARATLEFKDPRNVVVGILRSETLFEELLRCVSFVVYEVCYFNNALALSKTMEDRFKDARLCGFEVVEYDIFPHALSYEEASALKLKRAIESIYVIDGLVFAINHQYKVQNATSVRRDPVNLGKEILLTESEDSDDVEKPDFCVAFKVDTIFADTVVTDVVYEVTRFAKIFPSSILCEKVWMNATHDRCTGKTTKFIYETEIEPGMRIKLEKSGDIIPNFNKVLAPGPTGEGKMPPGVEDVDWEWDENKTHTYVIDKLRKDVQLARLIGFFEAFSAPGLKGGMVTKLFNHFYDQIDEKEMSTRKSRLHGPLYEILNSTEADLLGIPGFKETNATKIHKSIQGCCKGVKLETLLNASSLFEEGFGVKRFGVIIKAYGTEILRWRLNDAKGRSLTIEKITKLGGFNELANQFADFLPLFQEWLRDLPMIKIAESGSSKSAIPKASFGASSGALSSTHAKELKAGVALPMHVCFSGFRNEQWENLIKDNGGTIQSAVSGKTELLVVKDKSENSSKITKARERKIPILSKAEFVTKYQLSV